MIPSKTSRRRQILMASRAGASSELPFGALAAQADVLLEKDSEDIESLFQLFQSIRSLCNLVNFLVYAELSKRFARALNTLGTERGRGTSQFVQRRSRGVVSRLSRLFFAQQYRLELVQHFLRIHAVHVHNLTHEFRLSLGLELEKLAELRPVQQVVRRVERVRLHRLQPLEQTVVVILLYRFNEILDALLVDGDPRLLCILTLRRFHSIAGTTARTLLRRRRHD